MILFSCPKCQTDLSAEDQYGGQVMRCPRCQTAMRTPAAATAAVAAPPGAYAPPPPSPQWGGPPTGVGGIGSMGGGMASGRRYGFMCPHCSSRLEATESMAAQEGQCPTCGNNIVIPIQDRYGRLIDPITRQIIKQDPHPVHAYAAAGDRAPRIQRAGDGRQVIVCQRCTTASAISSNNCAACGMPFTMEGTTVEAAGSANGFCVASLVLGIIGIPTACTFVTPILAVVFGVIGLTQTQSGGGGRGMAIAGIILGVLAAGIALIGVLQ